MITSIYKMPVNCSVLDTCIVTPLMFCLFCDKILNKMCSICKSLVIVNIGKNCTEFKKFGFGATGRGGLNRGPAMAHRVGTGEPCPPMEEQRG